MLVKDSNLNQKSFVYPKDWGQGSRGCWSGGGWHGEATFTDQIDYITIATPGNATQFGTTTNKVSAGGTSGRGRGLIIGGHTSNDTILNDIKYVTLATTGNAADFGDLTRVTSTPACVSNGTRALICGGNDNHNVASGTKYSDMSYITIATPGNATGFGTITSGIIQHQTWSSSNQALVSATGNGFYGMIKCDTGDKFDYMSIDTLGNSKYFGVFTGSEDSAGAASGCSNGTRAIWNTNNNNLMEYFTWSSPSNALVFGKDSETNGTDSSQQIPVSDNSRAVLGAGHSYSDNMMYFSMDGTPVSTLIGAVFGDLQSPYSINRYNCTAFAGD